MRNNIFTKGNEVRRKDNILNKEKRVEGEKPRFFSSKGAIQVDYVIAAGTFIILFGFVVQYSISYFDNVREISDIVSVRSEAIELLGIVDRGFLPDNWPEIPKNDSSLVLLLHFNNETSDKSGLGNNGTAINGTDCSSAVEGRFFSGCKFDGTNDVIETTSSPFDPSTTDFTAEAWFKLRTLASLDDDTIIQQYNGAGGTGRTWISVDSSSSDTIKSRLGNTATETDFIPTVGKWHHAAVTVNGSTLRIYVDGILKNTSIRTIESATGKLIFGVAKDGLSNLRGSIDEVAIYNRSLSADEIAEHYERSLKRLGLHSQAYRFIVAVNNTARFYNDGSTLRNLNNESVFLNFSSILPNADITSVIIYNQSGNIVDHYVHGMNVSFVTNLSTSDIQIFTVYFSEGSMFPLRSKALVTGNNNTINETIYYLEEIPVLQYNKLVHLNQSNYTKLKESSDIENDFNVLVEDADTNNTVIQFGKEIPKRGNVVAFRRFGLFQNSTASVRNGRLTIRVW